MKPYSINSGPNVNQTIDPVGAKITMLLSKCCGNAKCKCQITQHTKTRSKNIILLILKNTILFYRKTIYKLLPFKNGGVGMISFNVFKGLMVIEAAFI